MEDKVTAQLLDRAHNRYFGKYRGIVEENTDDTNRGRLLVRVPALDNLEFWAMPCVSYAGEGVGAGETQSHQLGIRACASSNNLRCAVTKSSNPWRPQR